ncbi:uncharacterized protein SOCE26_071170 [Sorangium cellulosum]|uniref:Uncharacterized protein n=1 Tax=Sorangium cellulosum TaxID=56 RepID=A0A2L0F215_SORCE|nr:hypothetical protein [Sorangium cellulosum]AUX45622.1 uncharacterized protein SOCE26_071170 [Sorangium cellulosum]
MRWYGWSQQGTKNLVAAALCAAAALVQGCGDDGDGGAGTSANGGGGGGGGPSAGCVDARSHEALFSLADPGWCAVAVYRTDEELGYASLTWGRHGGPMLVRNDAQGAVEIVRLTPPDGADGELAAARSTIDVDIPEGAFLGGQALDLPFFGWTAISWTSAFPDTLGELLLLDERAAAAARYEVNGLFAAAAVEGRFLHTGLSPLGDPAAGPNGLYAADTCGAAGQDARLLPEGDSSCAAPAAVAAWGDNSGPVAADLRGNVFAVLPSSDGAQQARGFAAGAVARGAGPAEGDVLFTLPGVGTGLAAIAPEGNAPGLLVFQPASIDPYEALAPVAVPYSADGSRVQTDGEPRTFIELATPGTSVSLLTDEKNHLWIGGPLPDGGFLFAVAARR